MELYRSYSNYLKDKYGERVYKLPIKLDLTCPNRDGNLGFGGCIFCGDEGGSFENLDDDLSIKEQILINKDYIGNKYKANKFIAYFQNFTNTYMEIDRFKKLINQCILDDIVAISISTRPDCIGDEHIEFLSSIQVEKEIDIIVELGLQTVNYKSLKKINRGHSLAEYIDSSIKLKNAGIRNCTHLILNLPWDTMEDTIEAAKIMSSLGVEEVKLHSLYIVENTILASMYKKGEIELIPRDEYVERVISFLEYLDPEIVVQRLLGRAPEEGSLFSNWGESWWKIRDHIFDEMARRNTYQGRKFDYLNGKAIKKFR